MIQEIQASYDTIYETIPGTNNVAITVQPESTTPNTIKAALLLIEGEKMINNNDMLEGELTMVIKNTLKSVDWEIDDEGNLIIHAPDADNYSIDANGFLIYTWR
jgi:hypothetical protein